MLRMFLQKQMLSYEYDENNKVLKVYKVYDKSA